MTMPAEQRWALDGRFSGAIRRLDRERGTAVFHSTNDIAAFGLADLLEALHQAGPLVGNTATHEGRVIESIFSAYRALVAVT